MVKHGGWWRVLLARMKRGIAMARHITGRGERSTNQALTVSELSERLRCADEEEFAVLEQTLVADTRKGVRQAIERARRRLAEEAAERRRLQGMYRAERDIAGDARLIVGLDEVGRGPVAGPLAVGAVVLPPEPLISGLNDSKQVSAEDRVSVASEIKRIARAWCVVYIEPADIDRDGMSASLRRAFSEAISRIDAENGPADVVLIDGNPLHCDPREVNVVKGDATCASIAAASIIAKVERDALMVEYARRYPQYGFESNKGYASEAHIAAIKAFGLTPLHRETFCTAFAQQTLF